MSDAASFDSKDVVQDKLKGTRFLSSSVKEFWVLEFMRPIEKFCSQTRLTPNHISIIGFALTILGSVLLATDHLILGGWIVIWAGCCDFLDGRIARLKNLSSPAGAFFDSVLDRYMDFAVLVGLALLFRDSWVLYVVYAAFLGSVTTPYIKAKSESLGIPSSGGDMQRPERVVVIAVGAMLSGFMNCLSYPFLEVGEERPPYILIFSVFVVAYASNKASWGRFWHTFKQLQGPKASID